MAAKPYVALLRGINVGGRNIIPMVALRAAFEDAGFGSVATYIQSGNVVFTATEPASSLESRIESVIEAGFGVPIVVVVRSLAQLRAAVVDAPPGFGASPGTFHSDVVFLKAPLTPDGAMAAVSVRPEVDEAWPGKGVVYFQRLSARRTESRLSKIAGTPQYALMTIRTWNTTTKLLDMLERLP